ncbi:hypothetical protein ES703_12765 [subsurface metagenome]
MVLFTLPILVPYSNSAKTKDMPSADVETMCFKPPRSDMTSSMGTVTSFIISSGVARGYRVITLVIGSSMSGMSSILRVRVAQMEAKVTTATMRKVSHRLYNASLVRKLVAIPPV